jgi:hypothetical protein
VLMHIPQRKGQIDLDGYELFLEKDIIDDSSADEAIKDKDDKSGKLYFEGLAEQLIKSTTKETETKNGTEYTFSSGIDNSEDSINNSNTFKNLKGFGGMVLNAVGEGV